jgi:hypothetical protein
MITGLCLYVALTICAAIADVYYKVELPHSYWWGGGSMAMLLALLFFK